MSRSSMSRAARAVSLTLLAGGVAVPSAALAADAPTRSIGFTPAGQRTAELQPLAVSLDGKEVLQTDVNALYARNVAAGTTTKLIAFLNGQVRGVSTDLQRVLVETYSKHVAADTDAQQDLYLWNRQTGAYTLLTGGTIDINENASQTTAYTMDPALSGDGKVVHTGVVRRLAGQANDTYSQWKIDTATGVATKLSDAAHTPTNRLDDAGRVSVSQAGIKVGSATWPLPFDGTKVLATTATSPDGSAVAFELPDKKSIVVVNTATGAQRTVAVPSWLSTTPHTLVAPFNGGGSIALAAKLPRPAGERLVLGRLDVGGTLTQLGGDIPITNSNWASQVSPNLQFAATNLFLAQLGTTSLPGAEPGTPPSAKATDYLTVTDARCFRTIFGPTWQRPTLKLASGAQGADTRLPKRADVTVTMASGAVANKFSLSPGATRELNTGRVGGWTVSARVTLSDGATLDGTITIAPHPTPSCITVF